MRPTPILLSVLALAACASPSIDTRSTPPLHLDPALYELYSGEWQGTSYRPGDLTGTPWTLVQSVSVDGSAAGSLTFVGTTVAPAPVKLIEANDSTFISLIGPYYSPTVNAQVVTRVEGRITRERLWGTFYARPVQGGDEVTGRFEAVRVSPDTG
ncbi:MAG: hypothetical protein ACRENI_05775 [Gemmatimonadaceae bacterium]